MRNKNLAAHWQVVAALVWKEDGHSPTPVNRNLRVWNIEVRKIEKGCGLKRMAVWRRNRNHLLAANPAPPRHGEIRKHYHASAANVKAVCDS